MDDNLAHSLNKNTENLYYYVFEFRVMEIKVQSLLLRRSLFRWDQSYNSKIPK
jgi:hypothetical protein